MATKRRSVVKRTTKTTKTDKARTGGAFPINPKTDFYLIPKPLQTMSVDIKSVKPWGRNPRRNDEAAPQLAELIKVHGFRSPITVDQDGVIRKGNTAWKAARLLGMKRIPVVRHEFASEAAATAYAISDNRASEFAGWDQELLAQLTSAKSFRGYRGSIGFKESELKQIAGEAVEQTQRTGQTRDTLKDHVIVIVMNRDDKPKVAEQLRKWIDGSNFDAEVRE